MRAFILLPVSTRMRVGDVPGLRLQHLTKMQDDGCCKISLYVEEVSKQVTVFTRTECTQAIDVYLKNRQVVQGEVLKRESPIIRKEFS